MKFALGVEYDGSMYFGWQKQRSVLTIQGCIEQALSKIANYKIDVVCAGRTDKGVHAMMQIVHFSTPVIRSASVWLKGVNALLPHDITVLWLQEIQSDFHSRFSALSRSYRYIILNRNMRSSFLTKYYFCVKNFLDIKNMQISSRCLLGLHDFTAFKSSGCQSFSPYKNIIALVIYRVHDFVIIDITANSFLYHMVRNIVGSLIEVGLSKRNIHWIKRILTNKNINKIYSTVSSSGLYFLSATYSDHYLISNNLYMCKYEGLFQHLLNKCY
ncbi:tRNA pseudouridine synthase A [Buchnera aphidicola (Cinara splendens)]|uniref:tRNA pseudouridine synthase A n=1 Tax=Buchnera aphidicola (Cinara splendens) TaxID=2518979 RepID=A0A451DE72_9GAMM|nr:tRNA pseudouridine(38-40) synthase TruA [Buchnera aphidicola]VFP84898.1 tRNA pseudouridine synthase A [Buchnera aphidicola (Cinara splendens)]